MGSVLKTIKLFAEVIYFSCINEEMNKKNHLLPLYSVQLQHFDDTHF